MSVAAALAAYVVAAGLLTLTPGVDTAMVLRSTLAGGRRAGSAAAVGITAGLLVWGGAVALGVAALLSRLPGALATLRLLGGGYLIWLGVGLLRRQGAAPLAEASQEPAARPGQVLVRAFLSNLLNPKIGIFYATFLPAFIPVGAPPGPFAFLLAVIHAGLGLAWSAVLIVAAQGLRRALARPDIAALIDRVTGGVFLAFGAGLIAESRL